MRRPALAICLPLALTLVALVLPGAAAASPLASTDAWITSGGGSGHDWAYGSSVEADGTMYVTGGYDTSATFGSTTLTSAGGQDVYVAKIDKAGNFLWAASAGGTGGESGASIAVLSDGSAVVAGEFSGGVDFGTHHLTSAGGTDAFVARIDSDGTWLWARSAGSASSTEKGNAVAAAGDGAVLAGYYHGSFNLAGTALPYSGTDVIGYVAKIDADGTWQWAAPMDSTVQTQPMAVVVAADGSIFVDGAYRGTATFGAQQITSVADGTFDAFVAKISGDGDWEWAATTATSTAGISGWTWGTQAWGIDVAADGSPVIAGSVVGTTAFDAHSLTAANESSGTSDAFVAQLDPATGAWTWATSVGGVSDDWSAGVAARSDGSLAVMTWLGTAQSIGSTPITATGSILIAELSSDGTWQSAATVGGDSSGNAAFGLDACGSPHVAGHFSNSLTYEGTTLTTTPSNRFDMFAAKVPVATCVAPSDRPGSGGGDDSGDDGGGAADNTGGTVEKAARPTRVRWSAAVVRGRRSIVAGRALTATFAGAAGTTYAITAQRLARRLVTGRCARMGTTVRCTIRLPRAGRWQVAITPRKGGVAGPAARIRVAVRAAAPQPPAVTG